MGSNWSRRKSQGAKKSKPQDELLSDTSEGDIVVPCVSPSPTLVESCQPLHSVMGTTGSGRSTVGTYRWAISLPRRLRWSLVHQFLPGEKCGTSWRWTRVVHFSSQAFPHSISTRYKQTPRPCWYSRLQRYLPFRYRDPGTYGYMARIFVSSLRSFVSFASNFIKLLSRKDVWWHHLSAWYKRHPHMQQEAQSDSWILS